MRGESVSGMSIFIKALIFISLFVVFTMLLSCATVKTQLDDPVFSSQNAPQRTLKIIIASEEGYKKEKTEQFISQCSHLLDRQVGLKLAIVQYVPIQWKERNIGSMFATLKKATDKYDFDIAVGLVNRKPVEFLARNMIGDWDGCIDDTFRRYILIKQLDKRTLLHEIAHAFIFSHTHSHSGLMAPMSIQLFPFIPLKLESLYLTSEDRNEVLANKWRNFADIPELDSKEHQLMAR